MIIGIFLGSAGMLYVYIYTPGCSVLVNLQYVIHVGVACNS